ncbi:MAG: serine--tRNA ligase [Candidatus Nanoarchaeia archaeon]|nr:serine--tRNA ligase [Candidatus Nanoarchaeia archaeon]MDD3994163.1 serine--tRNA ligase [Candidatus Nanoarchaeia archaeon]MDD4563566.1 serine--tRNA ligase [Candidatus Nanoarchaeia archaeon]
MIDINLIRKNPDFIKENIKKKFQNEKIKLVDDFLKLDEKWRKLKFEEDSFRAQRNKISQEINNLIKENKKDKIESLKEQAKKIPDNIKKIQENRTDLEVKMKEILYKIPNIIHPSVPIGKDSSENVEVKRFGKIREYNFEVKSHVDLGEELGLLDFDTSADVAGKGFYFMKGELALLNMALINYARDFMLNKDFIYVEPPLMIKRDVLDSVYSTAEIEAMGYKIQGEDLYLIATSEHPLIAQFIGKTLNGYKLPIKQTGYSMCFRKEIGSHGIDEKGIYRTHQFNKQEMIVICEPEESYKWYDTMLNYSIELFKSLEIPFRVLECCSGDLADLKAKSCDLECWSPRRNEFFEVTSLTNMEEAQARRLGIKIEKNGKIYFAHTLNNTVIATSRALVAIMENNQNKDGSINIPKVLIPYMNGKTKIEKLN